VNVAHVDDDEARPRAEVHATAQTRSEGQPPREGKIRIEGRSIGSYLAEHSPKLAAQADKFDKLSADEQEHKLKSAFFSYTPYAIFALMPVFALYLKLLYLGSGRRYGEHLLFALHANAFAFLMLSLLLEAPSFIPFLHTALVLWLMFYLPTAMRRVYGGSRKITFLRWIVLMLLHLLSIVGAVVGAFGAAILA
jgi:hypothetical protein